eukprot:TRINITY_DN35537_c0_g1_i1.p1 TRINITY_DN35537_c0_g1~~TRINITY_DN35537_c0_g1_i1.p1  ORF type:complete len:318 (+),score=29.14 TRINITY_DN35537_c0_g1_i1:171-1124(+)
MASADHQRPPLLECRGGPADDACQDDQAGNADRWRRDHDVARGLSVAALSEALREIDPAFRQRWPRKPDSVARGDAVCPKGCGRTFASSGRALRHSKRCGGGGGITFLRASGLLRKQGRLPTAKGELLLALRKPPLLRGLAATVGSGAPLQSEHVCGVAVHLAASGSLRPCCDVVAEPHVRSWASLRRSGRTLRVAAVWRVRPPVLTEAPPPQVTYSPDTADAAVCARVAAAAYSTISDRPGICLESLFAALRPASASVTQAALRQLLRASAVSEVATGAAGVQGLLSGAGRPCNAGSAFFAVPSALPTVLDSIAPP